MWLEFSHPDCHESLILHSSSVSDKQYASKFKTVLQLIEKHNHWPCSWGVIIHWEKKWLLWALHASVSSKCKIAEKHPKICKNIEIWLHYAQMGYYQSDRAEAMSSLDTVQTIRHPNKTLWKWQIDHLCMSGIKGFNILSVRIALDLSS